jgi:hypothetical protein
MSNITKTLEVPKEMSEVVDAVTGIVLDIKLKKPVAEILAGNLQKLMTAVEGYEKLDEEQKTPQFVNAVAYLIAQLGPVLKS